MGADITVGFMVTNLAPNLNNKNTELKETADLNDIFIQEDLKHHHHELCRIRINCMFLNTPGAVGLAIFSLSI